MFDTTNMSPFAENHNRVGEGASRATLSAIPPKYCRGKSGLSRVELALLAYVIDHPEPWQQGARSAIAEDCDCAPNSVPRAARRLIALELIETVPGGGARNTIYRLGRNMEVTDSIDTRNADVSRNLEGTTVETLKLRAANSEAQTETTTTGGVVTQVTGGRNITPPHPLINTSSVVEGSPETAEPSFDRGLGGDDLFGADEPKRKRKLKRAACDATMPREPSRKMLEHAAKNDFFNGTVRKMFEAWRDFHIAKATPIADYEASWRTWVAKRVEWRAADAMKPKNGLQPAGVGDDGKVRYNRKRSYYVGA